MEKWIKPNAIGVTVIFTPPLSLQASEILAFKKLRQSDGCLFYIWIRRNVG